MWLLTRPAPPLGEVLTTRLWPPGDSTTCIVAIESEDDVRYASPALFCSGTASFLYCVGFCPGQSIKTKSLLTIHSRAARAPSACTRGCGGVLIMHTSIYAPRNQWVLIGCLKREKDMLRRSCVRLWLDVGMTVCLCCTSVLYSIAMGISEAYLSTTIFHSGMFRTVRNLVHRTTFTLSSRFDIVRNSGCCMT